MVTRSKLGSRQCDDSTSGREDGQGMMKLNIKIKNIRGAMTGDTSITVDTLTGGLPLNPVFFGRQDFSALKKAHE
jgi:hypothetical protein